jgi:hypothetical protein
MLMGNLSVPAQFDSTSSGKFGGRRIGCAMTKPSTTADFERLVAWGVDYRFLVIETA